MAARTAITVAGVLAVVAVGVAAAREVALERQRAEELARYRAALEAYDRSRLPPPKIKRGFIALGAGLGLASGLGACLAAGPFTIAACGLLGAAAGAGSNYMAQRAQGAK